MEFRPCIDIHNGKVKQIVGSSLTDQGNQAKENFISEKDAAYYAELYQQKKIKGGHIILLNAADSEYYEATKQQAISALKAYPGGLQIGGGIHADNAKAYLDAGASHVIVTSFVFRDGKVDMDHLQKMRDVVGKEHLVLDLSCRKYNGSYRIVTNRWQKMTDVFISDETLDMFSQYCDEFLIHAVDVEGKSNGIETELVSLLAAWNKIPMTYAGGVHAYEDIDELAEMGRGNINVTIGSALDLFGGKLEMDQVMKRISEANLLD